MIRLAAILLVLCSCTGHRQIVASETLDGLDVFCTPDAFVHRFPKLDARMEFVGDGIGLRVFKGCYEPASRECWAVTDNPESPDQDARDILWHEHCHRIEDLYGWEFAKYEWAALAKHREAMMTHGDINSRLKMEGLWPSILKGDF